VRLVGARRRSQVALRHARPTRLRGRPVPVEESRCPWASRRRPRVGRVPSRLPIRWARQRQLRRPSQGGQRKPRAGHASKLRERPKARGQTAAWTSFLVGSSVTGASDNSHLAHRLCCRLALTVSPNSPWGSDADRAGRTNAPGVEGHRRHCWRSPRRTRSSRTQRAT